MKNSPRYTTSKLYLLAEVLVYARQEVKTFILPFEDSVQSITPREFINQSAQTTTTEHLF